MALSIFEQQVRNTIIVSMMKETGWSRQRVVKALNFLEQEKSISFMHNGGLRLAD